MFWKDLEADIRTIISKLAVPSTPSADPYPNPSYMITPDKGLGLTQIKVSAMSSIKHTVSLDNSQGGKGKAANFLRNSALDSGGNATHGSSKSSFKIHIIKSDHLYENSCFFCKEDLIAPRRNSSRRVCSGIFFFIQDAHSIHLYYSYSRQNLEIFVITLSWLQIGINRFLSSRKQ